MTSALGFAAGLGIVPGLAAAAAALVVAARLSPAAAGPRPGRRWFCLCLGAAWGAAVGADVGGGGLSLLGAGVALALGALLLAIALIDLDEGVVYDALALALVLQALAWRWTLDGLGGAPLLGGVGGAVGALVARRLYRRVRGREGLGEGDVGLFAAAGVALPVTLVPAFLVLTGLLALGLGVRGVAQRGATWTASVPLAPPLLISLAFFLILEKITRDLGDPFRVFFGV